MASELLLAAGCILCCLAKASLPSPEASLSSFSQHGRWGSEMSVPRGLGRSHKSSSDLASHPLHSHGQTNDCRQGKGIGLPLLTILTSEIKDIFGNGSPWIPWYCLLSPGRSLLCLPVLHLFKREGVQLLDELKSNEGVIHSNGVLFKAVIIHVALSQHSYIQ